MKSRAARVTLLFLFIVTLSVTAYLFWMGESLADEEGASARAFEAQARAASRSVFDVRTAQQAYVAAGQSGDYWANKVAAGLDGLQSALAALRAAALSPRAQSDIDGASSILTDFAQLDRRARDYVRTNQNLLASDLIFGDGLDMTAAANRALDEALTAELLARDAAIQTFKSRQLFAVASAAAAALLVVLLLVPTRDTQPAPAALVSRNAESSIAHSRPVPVDTDLEIEGWSPPRPVATLSAPVPESAPAVPATPPAASEPGPAQPAPAAASTDFRGVAALCTELARVVHTGDLPSLLDRAATLLDASGIILWIADPDGRELNPIFAQGYPPQLVSRLGTLPREANNATAAAFRTGLLQTVRGDASSNGAIAAPLVTPSGCVGVMAAEVRNEGEKQEAKLSAGAILAAQLATLVGPPAARPRAEATGA